MPPTSPVTVIIPAYQGARYIAAAIESVKRQTLPVAEIVVVDDGSTDETGEVARALGARVIRQENKGVAAARNRALRAATQEWVAFLDHDDLWEPEKNEWQWRAHQFRPDAGIICCDFWEFDDADGRIVGPSVYSLPEAGIRRLRRERLADGITCLPKAGREFFRSARKNVFFPSALMVRRELALSVGLFNEDLPPVEDFDFFLRVLARSPLVLVERPLMRYRRHEHNASRNELRSLLAFFRFMKYLLDHQHLYPEGAAPALMPALPQKHAEAGRLLIAAGRFGEARDHLARSLRLRRSPRAAALLLATLAGPGAFDLLLKFKRTLRARPSRAAAGDSHGGREARGGGSGITAARPVSDMLSGAKGPRGVEELQAGAVPTVPEEGRR